VSERRYDPTLDEWVTFATHRQHRTFLPPAEFCPLCPTKPGAFPTEIERPEFEVAVFDNRFPALTPDPPEPDVAPTDLYPVAPALGRCEVVVYTSDHATTLAEVGRDRIRLLVDVWADRYAVLGSEPGIAYVMPFENKGEVIGVTLHHPHGQIYAYPEVPPRPARELRAARAHLERTGRCVECDVVAAELRDGRRLVADQRGAIAFVPFWARFPYEVHVVARAHRPSLPDLDHRERDDLAAVVQRLLTAYDNLFGFSMPYVMAIHSRPTSDGDWDPVSHLHLEFAPPYRARDKLKFVAGSEMMGGAYLTDVAPEVAAARLRGEEPA
jgi:UDPglucose--hexose-1-phosphate uridylyltransferase